MDKRIMHSPDLVARNIERIAELFPTVVTETRDEDGNVTTAIDFDLLRQELSDHIVEGPQERYRLDWPGKRAAAFAANAPIAKTLRPVREESVDFDTTKNVFIEGDNLDALKLLQESYLGKVKLIYIDPPYNTGKDFIYEDDFAETVESYLTRSGQVDEERGRLVANSESSGRFHSNWLSMVYPRLRLARNLLSEKGAIFVSIDDNEMASLRRVMDEVFGAKNFFAEMVVIRAEGGGLAKRVVKGHDYLIGYARDISVFPGIFRQKEVRGRVVVRGGREYWIETDWLRVEFGKYGTLAYEDIEKIKGREKKGEIDEGVRDGRYELIPKGGSHVVGRLRPLDEDGSKFYSVLKHLNASAKEEFNSLGMEGVFSNPKPLSLVKELIMGATRFTKGDGDIVLDFFAGSGTTAHAVLMANAEDGGNRRFICVQLREDLGRKIEGSGGVSAGLSKSAADFARKNDLPETLAGLARERIRRAGAGSLLDDSGYRAFRVDSGSLRNVLFSGEEVEQEELTGLAPSIKPDRTAEDLLFQVILDWGLALSLPIIRDEVDGREVFDVDEGALIACFAESVTPAVVQAIAERGPLRAVFRDDAFASDAARINAEQIFRELSPGTEVRTI